MANSIDTLVCDPATLPSDGSLSGILTVRVIDDTTKLPVAGATIDWTKTGTPTSNLQLTTSDTDENGEAVNALSISAQGIITVTATLHADSGTGTKAPVTEKTLVIASAPAAKPPFVFNASASDDHELTRQDINGGVVAEIPAFTDLSSLDRIVFHWDNFKYEIPVDASTILPLHINVKDDMDARCLSYGTHNIYYQGIGKTGNDTVSTGVIINVTDTSQINAVLPVPHIPQTDDDGAINYSEVLNTIVVEMPYGRADSPITIDPAADKVYLHWVIYAKNGIDLAERLDTLDPLEVDLTVNPPVWSPSKEEVLNFFKINMDDGTGEGVQYASSELFYEVVKANSLNSYFSETLDVVIDTRLPGENNIN